MLIMSAQYLHSVVALATIVVSPVLAPSVAPGVLLPLAVVHPATLQPLHQIFHVVVLDSTVQAL